MWFAVAALGVGLTTAMTITTTLLAQQPIGLSSEPLSAGNALVPPAASAPPAVVRHRAKPKPNPKPKPLSKTTRHPRTPGVKPVLPAAKVLATSPAVHLPTATVPAAASTGIQSTSGRQGSGRGDGHSGKDGSSKGHGGGGGGGGRGGGDD